MPRGSARSLLAQLYWNQLRRELRRLEQFERDHPVLHRLSVLPLFGAYYAWRRRQLVERQADALRRQAR